VLSLLLLVEKVFGFMKSPARGSPMARFIILFFTAMAFSGCNPAGMLSNEQVSVVSIDGIEIGVQPLTSSLNTYAAAPTDLSGGLIDPAVWSRNARAIQTVTGCRIDPTSIENQGLQTLAMVVC
jgi:hypothetical protein